MITKEENVMMLYDMACTIIKIINENYDLHAENEALKNDIKSQREYLDNNLTNAKKTAGQWMKLLLNGTLSYELNNYENNDTKEVETKE